MHKCKECQRINLVTHKFRDIIFRTKKSWKKVTINHIVKLSLRNHKNSILIIRDQNSGAMRLKATTEERKAPKI